MLNLGASAEADAPDPNMAPVLIDGVPIQSMTLIQVVAGAGIQTQVSITFHAEVTGNIGGKSIADMIKERQED
jgi:hypothetical protein